MSIVANIELILIRCSGPGNLGTCVGGKMAMPEVFRELSWDLGCVGRQLPKKFERKEETRPKGIGRV